MVCRRQPGVEGDGAVSPVVGMILVLAISIVGIAAILYWGLPAIDEMKANVEHRSLESQFAELDSTIKELVAGTTEKTAKRWQPTLNRGQVLIANETEGWVYSLDMYHPTENETFLWADFGDGNSTFVVRNHNASVGTFLITAERITGTTSAQRLIVDDIGVAVPDDAVDPSFPSSTSRMFKLFASTGAGAEEVPIRNATIRFRLYDGGTKMAEAWYVPTGRVDYELSAGLGTKTVTLNNGAVISGNGQTAAILNQPPIPPVANTSGVTRFFARTVIINGTGSFAGDDRFDVLVTLYSTATLGSYDCATTLRTDCVEAVRIYNFGTQSATWQSYLKNTARGYTLTSPQATINDGTRTFDFLEDREGWMGFTLLQSTVLLSPG